MGDGIKSLPKSGCLHGCNDILVPECDLQFSSVSRSSRLLVGSAPLIACGHVAGIWGEGACISKTAATPGPLPIFVISRGYLRLMGLIGCPLSVAYYSP